MKIGIGILPLPDPRSQTGSKRLFLDLAAGFSKKGHEVTVFVAEPAEGIPRRSAFRGSVYEYLHEYDILYRILGRKVSRTFNLPSTVGLFQETMFKGQDVLISVNDVRPFIVPNVGLRALSLHVLPPLFRPPVSAGVRRILKSDMCICCSRFLADTASKLFPGISDKFTFVHNGIDSKRFEGGDDGAIRRKLNIQPNDFVVLFVGRLVESKGVMQLLEAFREFHRQHQRTSLVLVGRKTLLSGRTRSFVQPDAYYDEVVKESVDLPVSILDTVQHEELADFYALADVLVCPSTGPETFGLVNVEAMAAGKPVIASRIGGIPEIVRDGETGFLVPPGEPTSIREKLIDLAGDENLRRSMGERGRRVAESSFSIEQMVDGYLSKMR